MKEFFLTVKAMRKAQKNYFAEKNPRKKTEYLEDSKRLEKLIDKMLNDYIIQGDQVVKVEQTGLF